MEVGGAGALQRRGAAGPSPSRTPASQPLQMLLKWEARAWPQEFLTCRQGKSGCCHQERGSRRTRRLSPDSGPPSRSVSRGCGPEGPSRASLRTSLRAQTSVSSRPPSDSGLQPGRKTGGPGAQSDLDRADPTWAATRGSSQGRCQTKAELGISHGNGGKQCQSHNSRRHF